MYLLKGSDSFNAKGSSTVVKVFLRDAWSFWITCVTTSGTQKRLRPEEAGHRTLFQLNLELRVSVQFMVLQFQKEKTHNTVKTSSNNCIISEHFTFSKHQMSAGIKTRVQGLSKEFQLLHALLWLVFPHILFISPHLRVYWKCI